MKKPLIGWFMFADAKNHEYAKKMIHSLRTFHSEEELPLIGFGPDILAQYNRENPSSNKRFFPIFTKQLMQEYETVIHFDVDQIITGSLDHILKIKEYDVAAVHNYNSLDAKKYGEVKVWDISAQDYFNVGFYMVRSEAFVNHWYDLCFSDHINNYQYIEQDIFNIICQYGNYKVLDLDTYDVKTNYAAFHGLISKANSMKMKMIGDDLILPRSESGFPMRDTKIKIIHFAGGNAEGDKFNYKTHYPEDVIAYLDRLTHE